MARIAFLASLSLSPGGGSFSRAFLSLSKIRWRPSSRALASPHLSASSLASLRRWAQHRWIFAPLLFAKLWWDLRPSPTTVPLQSFPRISSRTFLDFPLLMAKSVAEGVTKSQMQKFAPSTLIPV